MLRTLLESGATPTRRAGGTIVSIAAHTAAIALAIVATARATAVHVDNVKRPTDLVYTVVPTRPESPRNATREKPIPGTFIPPVGRYVVPPVTIPTGLPPIDAVYQGPAVSPIVFSGGGALGIGIVDRAGLVSPPGGVYTPRLVDKAAAPRPGNPVPVYPAALRAAQIEGTVLARFVVDSVGHAESASIDFPEATHPQFAEAVRQSLLRSRYLPAILDGRPVRQLVEQRFAFTLTR
jgi:TonB family protein